MALLNCMEPTFATTFEMLRRSKKATVGKAWNQNPEPRTQNPEPSNSQQTNN